MQQICANCSRRNGQTGQVTRNIYANVLPELSFSEEEEEEGEEGEKILI